MRGRAKTPRARDSATRDVVGDVVGDVKGEEEVVEPREVVDDPSAAEEAEETAPRTRSSETSTS